MDTYLLDKDFLLAMDFDGTMAQTFELSPLKMNVQIAYEKSVQDVFGEEGRQIYLAEGGLNNRAPSEVVNDLLTENQQLTKPAKDFFDANVGGLTQLVPDGKGIPLVWNESNPISVIGELLVRQKLTYLAESVGTKFPDGSIWPRPCRGFVDFWKKLNEVKRNVDGITIQTAVISSGHDLFILKTFRQWRVEPPDILCTEDDIRGLSYPKEMSRRVKPGQLQLALVHREWLRRRGVYVQINREGASAVQIAKNDKSRMVYIGDDPKKDGGLAEGAGIQFGHFNKDAAAIEISNSMLVFNDWNNIGMRALFGKERI